MGLWPGNKNKAPENKRLIIPLWIVLERAGSVEATVSGPYWTHSEALEAQTYTGEKSSIKQCVRKDKAKKEGRPFI